MKDVAVHTRVLPHWRVSILLHFKDQVSKKEREREVQQELSKWNLGFDTSLVNIPARQLPQEAITMKKNGNASQLRYRQDEADWSRDMRNKQMQLSVHM